MNTLQFKRDGIKILKKYGRWELNEFLLELAIDKWWKIQHGHAVDLGPGNCSLCVFYHRYDAKRNVLTCVGCPIFEQTGRHGCDDTPYSAWAWCRVYDTIPYASLTPAYLALAKAEHTYLIALLEKYRDRRKGRNLYIWAGIKS